MKCDLLIVGAGAAGCALAIMAARSGLHVLLLERPLKHNQERKRIEIVPVQLLSLLETMKMPNVLDAKIGVAPRSIVRIWQHEMQSQQISSQAVNRTVYQLDRERFDSFLLDMARELGTTVLYGRRICRVAPEKHGTKIELDLGEMLHVRYTVLAFGRSANLRSVGYRRIVLDHLMGVAVLIKTKQRLDVAVLEAIDKGWYYATNVSDSENLLVVMTNAEDIPVGRVSRLEWLRAVFGKSLFAKSLLATGDIIRELGVYNARTSFANPPATPTWAAIGDARIAIDPLSGQGLLWAMDDVRVVHEQILSEGWSNLPSRLQERTHRDLSELALGLLEAYRTKRFVNSRFWKMRRALADQLAMQDFSRHLA